MVCFYDWQVSGPIDRGKYEQKHVGENVIKHVIYAFHVWMVQCLFKYIVQLTSLIQARQLIRQ